jgi:hypothetical protein
MKPMLKFSILLNVITLGGLMFLLLSKRDSAFPYHPVVMPITGPPTNGVSAVAPVPSPAVFQPFRWAQLESGDYRAYIKNLRAIGCPEPTVRAIVIADVHALYSSKFQKLEQQLKSLDDGDLSVRLASFNERPVLEARLRALPGEQESEIENLLGMNPAALPMAGDASASTSPRRLAQSHDNRPVSMPIIFQTTDLALLNLTADQIQAIADLRQNFLNQIGSTADPNDPAYLARWRKAQPQVDDMLRLTLGSDVWYKMQMAAVQQ